MSNNKKIAVIIGAGPSGLACAYELINQNPSIKPIIIEKNSYVGGLAHTITNDCFGYDIFGYKLKTDYQYIKNIWFKFLKPQNSPAIDDIYSARYIQYPNLGVNPNEEDDVMLIRRDFSSIYKNSQFLLYSLGVNFSLIKQVGFKDFFSIIFSAIKSFIFKKPEITAKDALINRFGLVFYNKFLKDMIKKLYGHKSYEISSDFIQDAFGDINLFSYIFELLVYKSNFLNLRKQMPMFSKFYYPKFGLSSLWDLMADYIKQNGGEILLNSNVLDVISNNQKIVGVRYENEFGMIKELDVDYCATSMPLKKLINNFDTFPDIKKYAQKLQYRHILALTFCTSDFHLKNRTNFKTVNSITPEIDIIVLENDCLVSKVILHNNISPYYLGDFRVNYLTTMLYYLDEFDDLWQMDNNKVIELAHSEAKRIGLFSKKDVKKVYVNRFPNAICSYSGTYFDVAPVREFLKEFNNLYLLGSNANHKIMPIDEAMFCGINVAREIDRNYYEQ